MDFFFFFFFQAEDGIRDHCVTGVQTCALPISEEGLADPAAGRLLSRAKHLADVVVVDSPLLTSSPEMLSLADKVDEVLIVVRRGRTRLPELAELAELLSARGIRPAGFTVVGSGSGRGERVFDKAIERSWGLAWARH